MTGIARRQAPVALEEDGAEFRVRELGGDMSAAFVRLARGTDLRPALRGLPGDMCQCPHWGYLLRGRLRLHTDDSGVEFFEAGQSFYWAPGHAPEALEDCEYVGFSPSREFAAVIDHVRSRGRPAAG